MRTADQIAEEAKRLPPDERRQLAEELLQSLSDGGSKRSEAERLAALDALLALSGTAHSDFGDVSRHKGKHLAQVYAPKREKQ